MNIVKKNVLVFPCGSEIGLEIFESLKDNKYFNLIGASSVDDHGKYVFENYISGIPFITSPDVIPFLKKVVQDYHIDIIYPTMDLVISVLKKNEKELGCKVVASEENVSNICSDKLKTYQELDGVIKLPCIYSLDSINEDDFPVFIKPKIGYGAVGAKVVKDKKMLEEECSKRNDLLILEYLTGDEYTVDCFTDRKGCMLYANPRKRARVKGGISVNSFFVEDDGEFYSFASKISSKLHMRGAWFVQLKRDKNGVLTLLEVADRLGGTSGLSRVAGVNLAQLTLFDLLDYDVSIGPVNKGIVCDRALHSVYKIENYFENVYVDYDDTLVLEQKYLNPELMKFLFECRNKNKKLFLITKHKSQYNLENELNQFRIRQLFDCIILCDRDMEKYKLVSEPEKSIFIDDSYSERLKMGKMLNIMTFDVNSIDGLIFY